MAVTVETAAVFRGGGRRWFTLRAACAAEARVLLNKHCQCDHFEDGQGQHCDLPCNLHHPDRYPRIMKRLTKGLMRRYRASQP
ncbi:hypothetical protein DM813_19015 [Pseudomonas alkylphenolica]|uniref:Uncharacterized protein n=1 Tax=Pseudomonas alkylphenolica TaxID=237609 RepID=A0A443ZQ87_9PSED|nr:hypothetical protein DM813_19015 [Pseudomonas alkylphenolica]